MQVSDPLVVLDPSTQARLRGWAVAAAIIARLQEVDLSLGIDAMAILAPTLSDLGESELAELDRQLSGPLTDTGLRTVTGGLFRADATRATVLQQVVENGRG